ncbi:Protein of unknown function (DUF2845) [Promicromonospora umidemergens]|nr:DUF2845 domain-containing protein [Promicromonospora umidemergens]MCP2286694.1 Protein of unknown function (DUF2845) [Promicromonospora umidemergens]
MKVKKGMTKREVKRILGRPARRDVHKKEITVFWGGSRSRTVVRRVPRHLRTETWIFPDGPNETRMDVTFQRGRVTSVREPNRKSRFTNPGS